MRLAQGQVRRILADRPHHPERDAAGQGPREGEEGHGGDAQDAEDRHRDAEARLRAEITDAGIDLTRA